MPDEASSPAQIRVQVSRAALAAAYGCVRGAERRQAGDVDDATPARVDHAGQHRLHHLHRGAHVQVVGRDEIVQVDRADAAEPCQADVVDHGVDPAFADDRVQGLGRGGLVAEVDLVELSGEIGWRAPSEPDGLLAGGSDAVGDRAPDTLRGSSDQHSFRHAVANAIRARGIPRR